MLSQVKPPFRAEHIGSLLRPTALLQQRAKFARGEIDAAALIARLPAEGAAEGSPLPEIEEKLASIWRSILKVEDISTSDDFFDLGGTSLKSVRMVLEVDEAFGQDVLPPDQLFAGSRFDEIAAIIRRNLG